LNQFHRTLLNPQKNLKNHLFQSFLNLPTLL
jgi:hypothetical protein